MSAIPLFDFIMTEAARAARAGGSMDHNKVQTVTEQLIISALNERSVISAMDIALAGDALESGWTTAVLIRGMYEQWAREAEAVLDRAARVKENGIELARYDELRDAHGRTRAMLKVSLEEIEHRRKTFAQGPVHTREDVRRQLGLKI
jgi:hypothetical protein